MYLLRGAEMWRLAAQVLGKAAGYNTGTKPGRATPWTISFDMAQAPPVLRMLRGAARTVPADAHRKHLLRKYR